MDTSVVDTGIVVAIFTVIAVLFAPLAWATGRRYGGRGLALAWVVGTCAATAYGLYMYRFNLRIFGPTSHEYRITVVLPFCILGLAAFGGAASAVHLYMRNHVGRRLSGGLVAASISGFYLGTVLGFTLVLLVDVSDVLRHL